MGTIARFEDIEAWQTARQLANLIYDLTESGKFEKDYGLKNQIQRAAVSVMSNIAEGFESHTQAISLTCLGGLRVPPVRFALSSSLRLTAITSPKHNSIKHNLTDKASRQIYRFMEYLKSQPNARRIREDRIEYNL